MMRGELAKLHLLVTLVISSKIDELLLVFTTHIYVKFLYLFIFVVFLFFAGLKCVLLISGHRQLHVNATTL